MAFAATLLVSLIALATIFIPGILLALPLLKRTGLNIIEIIVIGFIIGFIATPTITWLESYLMNSIHFFTFSLQLYLINAIALTIIGLILCMWQGVFKDFNKEFLASGNDHKEPHQKIRSAPTWVWMVLIFIMLITFSTRLFGIGNATTFFEFDPYFDMVDTQYILTYGQQLLLDPSAWPSVPGGTNHRIEPIIPYVEAYWYDLSNIFTPSTQLNTNMLSLVGSVYPPITAALLVFVIFVLLFHEYNEHIALIAASLTSAMPVLFATFIAGEQLVEPWGIFALFFFLAAYMLSVRNPKNPKLAILAGLAFVSNFLGAHYYTVTTGVFAIYLLLQGIIDVLRGEEMKDFYKSNAIVTAVITIFFLLYLPYSSTLQNRIPSVAGVPIVIAAPILALIAVWLLEAIPKLMAKNKILITDLSFKNRIISFAVLAILGLIIVAISPLGKTLAGYIYLSKKFTTPSSPLFMTVEEYIPTGFLYNFGAQGFGMIGASTLGIPLIIWIISAASLLLIAMSIYFRRSRTGILYAAIALPLMFAGFSEVKYLPHFGVAYIMFFAIVIGELIYLAERNFVLKKLGTKEEELEQASGALKNTKYTSGNTAYSILAIGLFFVSTVLSLIYLAYVAMKEKGPDKRSATYLWALFGLFVIILLIGFISSHIIIAGEVGTYYDVFRSALVAAGTPNHSQLCNTLGNSGLNMGFSLYCNNIPQYWLSAMAWIKQNVGPYGPRVLSWWDYGDWINWFGNSNAFLRGDNANATEDYATAAHFVLGDIYNPQSLAKFMNNNQSKYVLFDQDLVSKWQALDFLGCVYANLTSQAFATAQGQASNPPVPFQLGTSQCEQQHDPQFAFIPLAALLNQSQGQSINLYCTNSTSTAPLVQAPLLVGSNFTGTACVNINPNAQGALTVYNQSGKKLNAYIQSSAYLGVVNLQGTPFVQYLMVYTPNTNGIIVNPPSKFYTSNFYNGFFLGKLPGFTQVYPQNATGINNINGTYSVRIFAINNFTGQLPPVPAKPSWIHNNYSMP